MDANMLRYYIADRGQTMASYEQALGISKTALYRKMKGMSEFTREEIEKTIHFLELNEGETMAVFFGPVVS
ncbi:MAG: XRE family transcriptional regulator [Clostridiales bacterium]|nr:XRE family transcriptional regulator [Clostridiales bacterium]